MTVPGHEWPLRTGLPAIGEQPVRKAKKPKRPSFRLTAAKLLNRLAEDGLEQRRFWKDSKLFSVWVTKKEITILKTAANILTDKSRQEKALRKQVRELKKRLKYGAQDHYRPQEPTQ